MHKIWTLSMVMLKSSLEEQFNAFRGKKNAGFKSLILFGVLGIYIMGIIVFMGHFVIDLLVTAGQPSLFIFLLNFIMPLLILCLTLFSIPIILYYSNDNATYFVLPLKPSEIVAGKAITIYIQTLITTLVFLAPLFVLYFVKVPSSIFSILMALLSIFIIPVLPILIATLLIVLIFTFTPFFRSKEAFTYVSTFVSIILVIVVSQISTFAGMESLTPEMLIEAIQSGNDTIFTMISSIFPTTSLLTNAIVNPSIVSYLLAVGISILAALVVFKIAEPFYFKTVLLFTETKRSNKRTNLSQLSRESTQKSIIPSMMQYDFRNILRTPAFVANYYLPYLMVPVMIIFSIYSSITGSSALPMDEIREFIRSMTAHISGLEFVIFGYMFSLSVGLFFSNLGNPTSTLISREGVNATEFLMFPTKMSNIVKAKMINALLPTIPLPILFIVGLIVLFRLPFYLIPCVIIGIVIGGLYVTSIGSLMDMSKPRLNWVNEQDAVKGNIRQIFVILPFMFLPIVLIIILISTQSLLIWGLVGVGTIAAAYPLVNYTLKYADTRLVDILQNQ